jgi:hypothetical protein
MVARSVSATKCCSQDWRSFRSLWIAFELFSLVKKPFTYLTFSNTEESL